MVFFLYFSVGFMRDCFTAIPQANTASDKIFLFPPNSSVKDAAFKMQKLGWVKYANSVILLSRLRGISTKLHYGEYKLSRGLSVSQLLDHMYKARNRVVHHVMFIPGKTFLDLLGIIKLSPKLNNDLTAATLSKLIKNISPNHSNPEGLFFPDTYNFTYGVAASTLLKKSHQRMAKQLARVWEKRDVGLPYKTPYQLLVVASLIQSEALLARERPLVSSVIENRLNRNMYLQIDPTVIYGLHRKLGLPLTASDLKFNTPYNTYLHKGLPPTPIDMPSLLSLKAAAHPAKTQYLYFVLSPGNKGSHVFSNSLKEHQHAVRLYRRFQHS